LGCAVLCLGIRLKEKIHSYGELEGRAKLEDQARKLASYNSASRPRLSDLHHILGDQLGSPSHDDSSPLHVLAVVPVCVLRYSIVSLTAQPGCMDL